MDDLTTRVAKLLWAKLPHPQTCPEAIDEAAAAVVKLVLDEAAMKAGRYVSFPQPTSRAARYHEAQSVRINIAAAIRALGVQS